MSLKSDIERRWFLSAARHLATLPIDYLARCRVFRWVSLDKSRCASGFGTCQFAVRLKHCFVIWVACLFESAYNSYLT